MAANVETMFYNTVGKGGMVDTRKTPWHGLGTPVMGALNSADALKAAGLDWNVVVGDAVLKLADGSYVETDKKITYRDSDNKPLGFVSDQYSVVQNIDAFSFTDKLIDTGEVKYETAGSLDGGKKVFLLANLPETVILGDKVMPYLLFSNSHDGTSSVRVTATPVRVVCQNTLNLALDKAQRIWSFIHKGDIMTKVHEAQVTLKNMKDYMEEEKKEAERLASIKIGNDELQKFMEYMFPAEDKANLTHRKARNVIYLRDAFMQRYNADDLANFKGTGWGLVNAASDFASHTKPIRTTQNHQEKVMISFMNGNRILDATYSWLTEKKAA